MRKVRIARNPRATVANSADSNPRATGWHVYSSRVDDDQPLDVFQAPLDHLVTWQAGGRGVLVGHHAEHPAAKDDLAGGGPVNHLQFVWLDRRVVHHRFDACHRRAGTLFRRERTDRACGSARSHGPDR